MNKKFWIVLLFTGLILAGCILQPGLDDPVDSLEDEGEEMVFEEEEVIDDPVTDEDLEFTDEEGTFIYLESIPPAGQWSLKHLPGDMICPDIPTIGVPGTPPIIVILVISEDGKTMTFPSAEGTITLTQVAVSTEGDLRGSFYEGTLSVEGGELLYQVDYNLMNNGRLGGSVEFTFGECRTVRLISAEYVGP